LKEKKDMKYRVTFFALLFAITLFLPGCGADTQTANTQGASPQQSTPTPSPSPTPLPKPKTAEELLKALITQHMPIGESFTYTEENDVNHLLGRPGQYTGKVNFKDTRITDSTNNGANISVRDGGSIETFANASDATKRFKYIQGLSQSGTAMFAEYEYLEGTAILRISSVLTPKQAKSYDDALKVVQS
jgi:hypothetical protein